MAVTLTKITEGATVWHLDPHYINSIPCPYRVVVTPTRGSNRSTIVMADALNPGIHPAFVRNWLDVRNFVPAP